MLESTFVYSTLLFMKKGFSVGVSILLFRCLNKRKYEYVYLIEMWVNFLCISVGKALRERGRNTNTQKMKRKHIPYYLTFVCSFGIIFGHIFCVCVWLSIAFWAALMPHDRNKALHILRRHRKWTPTKKVCSVVNFFSSIFNSQKFMKISLTFVLYNNKKRKFI